MWQLTAYVPNKYCLFVDSPRGRTVVVVVQLIDRGPYDHILQHVLIFRPIKVA